ncbi:hypothetical protein [Streptomyces viridosporus]|uniref:hypothetical protein n=1 Tax=Streptomyces viridosporus TaxID=67581 RepID=UPI00331F3F6D
MTREQLAAALTLNGCDAAHEARARLLAGADFTWLSDGHRAQSAHRYWDVWSWRLEVMLDTGVMPRPGLAEAVAHLRAADEAETHLATVSAPDRRFTVFLSADLTNCIACM